MRQNIGKIVLFGAIFFAVGGFYGSIRKPDINTACSIMLAPSAADAGESLKGLAMDAPSPIMALKGVLESHSCSTLIANAVGVPEKQIRDQLQIKPNGKEMRLELAIRSKADGLGKRALWASLRILREKTTMVTLALGNQQAETLKSILSSREEELKKASDKLAKFQRSFKSSLQPEVARGTVLALNDKVGLAQQRYDAMLQMQNQAVDSAKEVDASEALAKYRAVCVDIRTQLRTAQITYGEEAPAVITLKAKLKIAEANFQQAIESARKAITESLEPKLATQKVELMSLKLQLEQATEAAKTAAEEAQTLFSLKREVETVSATVNTLRASYEQARVSSLANAVNWTVLDEPYDLESPTKFEAILKYGGLGLAFFLLVVFGYIGVSRALKQV